MYGRRAIRGDMPSGKGLCMIKAPANRQMRRIARPSRAPLDGGAAPNGGLSPNDGPSPYG